MQRAVGLFSSRQAAEAALSRLNDSGFDMNHISIVAKSGEGLQDISGNNNGPVETESNSDQAQDGAGAGATAGAVTGGAIGLIGSLGVLAIPGVGIAAELGFLLANTLLGSGIGAVSGGLIGALVGWGVPEDQAKYYNDRVYNDDNYLVLVEGTQQEISAAKSILEQNGISDWSIYGSTTGSTMSPNYSYSGR
ncbi:MAG: hypothetical protein HC922_02235 [Leptolyngbyaceae cyanobacterium SM2_3_12]|nr:hypothetical protein [Leptolyngbyaceae cyanobacterium SM2_3_12]